MDDYIKKFLETTGLSFSELAKRVEQYKVSENLSENVVTSSKDCAPDSTEDANEACGALQKKLCDKTGVIIYEKNNAVDVDSSSNCLDESSEHSRDLVCTSTLNNVTSETYPRDIFSSPIPSIASDTEVTEVRVVEVEDNDSDSDTENGESEDTIYYYSKRRKMGEESEDDDVIETAVIEDSSDSDVIEIIDEPENYSLSVVIEDERECNIEQPGYPTNTESAIERTHNDFDSSRQNHDVPSVSTNSAEIPAEELEEKLTKHEDPVCPGDHSSSNIAKGGFEVSSDEKEREKPDTTIAVRESPLMPSTSMPENVTEENVEKESGNHNSNVDNVPSFNNRDTGEDEEQIRNILKLQLSSLRNRKKRQLISSRNICLGLEDKSKATEVSQPNTDQEVKELNIEHDVIEGDELYKQTSNELGFVIAGVEGGIECDDLSEAENENINNDILHSELPYEDKSSPYLPTERFNNEFPDASVAIDGPMNKTDSKIKASFTLDQSNKLLCRETIDDIDNKGRPDHIESNIEKESEPALDALRKIIHKQKVRSSILSTDLTEKRDCTSAASFSSSTEIPNKLSIDYEFSTKKKLSDADGNKTTGSNNSPFISNKLDEFLTENSTLNISYEVPKLDAEEGLKETSREHTPEPLPKLNLNSEIKKEVSDKEIDLGIKAKTLAEKRKLLERHMKNLKKTTLKERKKDENIKKQPTPIKIYKNSFVVYNGTKLRVASNLKKSTCLGNIYFKTLYVNPAPVIKGPSVIKTDNINLETTKKPSLLNDYAKSSKVNDKMKYKAGPLCKKQLQNTTNRNGWIMEIKKLPKISLQLTPEMGKPIHPYLWHLLPKCDGVVSEDQVKFALSVVKPKNDNDSFTFSVPYKNNQEHVIVRKRKIVRPPPIRSVKDPDIPVQYSKDEIAGVLNDLIRYVEIKEEADSVIIKDDNYEAPLEENNKGIINQESAEDGEHMASFVRKSKKKSKVDWELRRLSCKVINVKVDEGFTEENCTKAHCKMGCVCRSLMCETFISYHCRKVQCMFECTCPKIKSLKYDEDINLPPGTDLLSTATVSRLEDQAKKHLAKVEREFTQTVIHANNRTIVVGSTGRDKARRNAKAPKKYGDFVENIDRFFEKSKGSLSSVANLEKQIDLKEFSIHVENLNLQNVLPLCLDHRVYNCIICGFKRPINNEIKHEIKTSQISRTNFKESSDSGIKEKVHRKKKIRISKYQITSDSCARVRGVPFEIVNRNKNVLYTSKLFRKFDGEFIQMHQCDQNDPVNVEYGSSDDTFDPGRLNHKRKQCFSIREDIESKALSEMEHALQRRKKIISPWCNTSTIGSVFDGEIILEKRHHLDLLKKMGPDTLAAGYARLLPWYAFLENFNRDIIRVWCMASQPSRLLINTSDKEPPKSYVDIRQTNQPTEVISWILTSQLPPFYDENTLSFILKPSKEHFEICGICRKMTSGKTVLKSPAKNCDNMASTDSTVFYHKDASGEQKTLKLTKHEFPVAIFVPDGFQRNPQNEVETLFVAKLPTITSVCRWRVVFLNSDFTYLHFFRNKYSIKYTDLSGLVNAAKCYDKTILITSKALSVGYSHVLFGMYFVPSFQDRIFIGPYFRYENHDLETLRYIQHCLVDTVSFNKMQGRVDYSTGMWINPTLNDASSSRCKVSTIDLTHGNLSQQKAKITQRKRLSDSEDRSVLIKRPKVDGVGSERYNFESLEVNIIDSAPRKPEEFNRYIITNIPHFGYLGAYQAPNSSTIDVSWPFENKLLRFPDMPVARAFLRSRLSLLLQPIPEDFEINVIVMTDIDLTTNKPIDAKFLRGHYICGEFGVLDVKTITDEVATTRLGMSREDLMRIFAKRAQSWIKQRLEEFAQILSIDVSKQADTVHIIDTALKEIKTLKHSEQTSISMKNVLELMKQQYLVQINRLISSLPAPERETEAKKLKDILSPSGDNSFDADVSEVVEEIECIEIPDSDNDEVSDANSSSSNLVLQKTPEKKRLKQYPSANENKSPHPLFISSGDHDSSSSSDQERMIAAPEENGPVKLSDFAKDKKIIAGVKLVKTNSGNLVLVPETSPLKVSPTKLIIKNNMVTSVMRSDT